MHQKISIRGVQQQQQKTNKVSIRGLLQHRKKQGQHQRCSATQKKTRSALEVFCNRGNKVSIRGIMQHTKQGQHQRCLAALANKVTIRSVQQQ